MAIAVAAVCTGLTLPSVMASRAAADRGDTAARAAADTVLAVRSGALLSAVQRERGLSALSGGGGTSTDAAAALARADTDGAVATWASAAGTVSPHGELGVGSVRTRLAGLGRERALLSRGVIGPSASFAWYTDLARRVLACAAGALAESRSLGAATSAYGDLLTATETLGQEQATVAWLLESRSDPTAEAPLFVADPGAGPAGAGSRSRPGVQAQIDQILGGGAGRFVAAAERAMRSDDADAVASMGSELWLAQATVLLNQSAAVAAAKGQATLLAAQSRTSLERDAAHHDLVVSMVVAGLGWTLALGLLLTSSRLSSARARRAQHRAALDAARFDAVLATIADAVLTFDASGRIERANRAAEDLFGYQPGDLLGRDVAELMPDAVASAQEGYLRQPSVSGEERFVGNAREVTGCRRDGSAVQLEVMVTAASGQGRVTFTGILRDVSDRQRRLQELAHHAEQLAEANRQLAEREQFVLALAEHFPGLVAHVDIRGVMTFANRTYQEWFARSPEDLHGRHISDVMGSVAFANHMSLIEGALQGRPQSFEDSMTRRDGRVIHILAEFTPDTRAGRATGFFLTVTDITRFIQVQEELALTNDQLAAKTLALARSNTELQEFAAVASHDLQEPLRKVARYVEILEADYADHLDEAARQYIGYASDGARRMQTLIKDLLAVSQLRAERMSTGECDTGELVRDVLDGLDLAVREAGATVQIQDLPVVPGDRAHLRQVFHNLLSNALKYRADRPLLIEVSARPDDDTWHFAVRDNGIGFKQEYAEQVFGMFKRLVTRDAYTGTGIGLAIAAKVIANHGGRIWVTSEPGVGTTFEFTLPAPATNDRTQPTPSGTDVTSLPSRTPTVPQQPGATTRPGLAQAGDRAATTPTF